MAYAFTVYNSIGDVPAEDWEALRQDEGDLATDRRLIRCVEQALDGQGRCWVVVGRDGERVVAGACLALFRVDAAETTGPVVRRTVGVMRRVAPGALRFGVLFCGLPAPSGDGQLRIVPGADVAEVMRGLDEVMDGLARREGAGMVVIKELGEAAAREIEGVESMGYVRGDVPAVYVLRRTFACFEEYCAQLRTDYRRKVELSARKLRESDCGVEYWYGEEIARGYTEECHRLYEAVLGRAAYRLERWPAEFFRGLARAFGPGASMTRIVRADGRPVAWEFGVTYAGVYHNLYGGLDYASNDGLDPYFNVYYRDLGRAFRDGVRAINLGQTSESFKARLGAEGERLYFYARGVRPAVRVGLRVGRRWAFPEVAGLPVRHVFRDGATRGVRR